MPVELDITLDNFLEDDLIEIYKFFCKAYGITFKERDEKTIRSTGLKDLKEPGGIDYAPYRGAKFFGQKVGTRLRFHGYSMPNDLQWESKDKRFQELVLEYFQL